MPGMEGMGANGSVILALCVHDSTMAVPSLHHIQFKSLEKMYSHYILWRWFTSKASRKGAATMYVNVYYTDILKCF